MHKQGRPISPMTAAATVMIMALSSCFIAGHAPAQIGEGTGLAEALSPEYFNRDIVIFTEGLDLDETQRVIVEALFEDYLDAFEDAKAIMSQSFDSMPTQLQGQDKSSIVRLALQPLRDLINTKDSLRDQLMSNVQTVLTDEQLNNWPSFMRKVRRQKYMHKGRLDGESLDLFHVLRDLDLTEEGTYQIQLELDEYEEVLDLALMDRENSFKRAQISLLDSISQAQRVVDTTEAERQVSLRVRIRDVNNQYRDTIAASLPGDVGSEFNRIALQRGYPQIYRRSLLERSLEGALALDSLSDEQYRTIQKIQGSFAVDIEGVNATLLANLLVNQPQEMRARIESFRAKLAGEKPKRTTTRNRESMYHRDEIAQPYMERLEALLSDEQFAMLPQAQRFLERQRRLGSLRHLEGMMEGENKLSGTRDKDGKKPPDGVERN